MNVYDFELNEVSRIAERIKNARAYYTHYEFRKIGNSLNYHDQNECTHFLQDVVLFNIYKLIGIDIKRIKQFELYYLKSDLKRWAGEQ